jgi:hypothetical protein
VDYFSAKRTQYFIIAGKGGGVIQGTASEAVLVVMLAARNRVLKHVSSAAQGMSEAEALSKLVVYSSDQTHSCVIKACQVPNLLALKHPPKIFPVSILQNCCVTTAC